MRTFRRRWASAFCCCWCWRLMNCWVASSTAGGGGGGGGTTEVTAPAGPVTLLCDEARRRSDCVSTALSTPSGLMSFVTLYLLYVPQFSTLCATRIFSFGHAVENLFKPFCWGVFVNYGIIVLIIVLIDMIL